MRVAEPLALPPTPLCGVLTPPRPPNDRWAGPFHGRVDGQGCLAMSALLILGMN